MRTDVYKGPVTGAGPEEAWQPRVWVVRADGGLYANHFVAGGYAGCFSKVAVSSAGSRDEIRRRYKQAYPGDSARAVGVNVGQLAAFRFEMREGDDVITPTALPELLHYGRVAGPCVSADGDDGCPYRNRRAVDWADKRLGRASLSESLQNTLGSMLAVFEVSQREEFLTASEGSDSGLAPVDVGLTGGEVDQGDSAEDGPPQMREAVVADRRVEVEEESGVEAEREDPQEGAMERPFDPSKIKVRTVQVVVGQLISRITHDEIDLAPDFQRMSGIWNSERKSRLIESILLRIPIPVFYVAADEQEKWAVVDGVQRISTIYGYVTGKFPLTRLEYREEFNGRLHDSLPRAMQRRISETQIVVNVIEPGTPPEVMFNIFRRINTGGMPLRGQEIRHALNPGPIRACLKDLAESKEFVAATDGSIKKDRMADRECVLRFLAFHMEPWEQFAGGSLASYLAAAMKTINAMAPERLDSLADDFKKAMRAAERIFGNDAFRKRSHPDDARNPVSMPLFEAWGVQLARCSPEQIDRLVARREEVRNRLMTLVNENSEFYNAISYSTGVPQRIRRRFAAIRDLVQELL